MRFVILVLATVVAVTPLRAAAQDTQTLADIRQELSVLYVEIQKLKRDLSTTGAPTVSTGAGSVLERVGAIEAELQRLTSTTEQMDHRIQRIVTDGTNRIGDLEFRLVELEGGDLSALGETSTLGGAISDPSGSDGGSDASLGSGSQTGAAQSELAMGEQADFDAANKALAEKDYATAAAGFGAFLSAYPGSPLAAQASLSQGQALDGVGDTREAARSYLASFSADSNGPVAPEALTQLGAALGRLGQTQQACVTLGEVELRFPGSNAVAGARQEMAALGCG